MLLSDHVKKALAVGVVLIALFVGSASWRELFRARGASEVHDSTKAAALQSNARVILVTIDGPLRADVFSAALMPRLHEALAARKGLLVEANAASSMALSLPGYKALALGHVTDCLDNDCARTTEETVAEFLSRQLHFEADQSAVFASWSRMVRAASARDGVVFVDAPDDGPPHEGGPRWRNARFDDDTFSSARSYWDAHHPRFLHIALLDTDEWAHAGYRKEYETALASADSKIAEVLAWIDSLPADQRALTTLIITADHGRGRADWREHGFFERGSGEIFFAAFGASVNRELELRTVSQLDVRPTIERLFGLCTDARRERGAGSAVPGVVENLPCDAPSR